MQAQVYRDEEGLKATGNDAVAVAQLRFFRAWVAEELLQQPTGNKKKIIESINNKVEQAIKSSGLGQAHLLIDQREAVRAQYFVYGMLHTIKWDQEDGAQEVLEDIKNLENKLRESVTKMTQKSVE